MQNQETLEIGKRLAEIRDAIAGGINKRFTEMLCSEDESVSETTVGSWIKGDTYPQINFAMKAARLYGKTLDWLFTGEDPPDQYKELLRNAMIADFRKAGMLDKYDLTDDEVFDQLARAAFDTKEKQGGG